MEQTTITIKGQVEVSHYKRSPTHDKVRGYIYNSGSSMVDSKLVIKPGKAVVWVFDSPLDSDIDGSPLTRKSHTFIYDDMRASSYITQSDGSTCEIIEFTGKHGYDGSKHVYERLSLSSFDGWQTMRVYLYYYHRYYAGQPKQFRSPEGDGSFEFVTPASRLALTELYQSLRGK